MLQSPLFKKSWHEFHTFYERQAVADVEKLDEKVLFSPELSSSLESIAAKYKLDVAKLGSQAGTAKAVKHHTGRAYVDALQIPIPFTGSGISLDVRPSHSHIISVPAAEIKKDHVLITVYEAGNPAKEVEDFIKRGNENLDTLRDEVKRYDGEILKTITLVANQRRTKIEERQKRDAALPFKVDRGQTK
jgi:hypothetical protein